MRALAIVLTLLSAACHLETEKEMGLLENPPTRPRTYVEGEPVDPNDMNEIFDRAIADAARLDAIEGSFWRWEIAGRAMVELNVTLGAGSVLSTGVGSMQGMKVSAIPEGWRPTALAARVKGNPATTGDAHIHLWRNNGDGTSTELGDLFVNNPPNAWATYTLDPLTVIAALAAPASLYIDLAMTEADVEFASFALKIERIW